MAIIMGNTGATPPSGYSLIYQAPAGIPSDIVLTAGPSTVPGDAVTLATSSTLAAGTFPGTYQTYNLPAAQTITLREFEGSIYAAAVAMPTLSWVITTRA